MRPKVFNQVVYYVQNGDLFREGYLAKLKYSGVPGFDRKELALNSTGADYTDKSLRNYYRRSGFPDLLAKTVVRLADERRNILVFTRFIEEAASLVKRVPGSAIVTGETPKKEREKIIEGFRDGRIKTVANCGVLTTGFDYPELETIVMARPTMSLALYYQMAGRSMRTHLDKDHAEIVDLCGNIAMFGKIENLKIEDGGNGKWFVSGNGRPLTNVYYGER
jgi:DNA repair protein RadD